MKQIIIAFSLFCFALESTAQPKEASSLLWEISGNGLAKPSYLFGTFHLMCATDFTISSILNEKLTNTEQFYGEIDLSKPNWQTEMAKSMILKDQTIEALMGKLEYDQASLKFKEITGLDMNMLNNAKPFMGLSLLVMNSIPCTDKIQPETMFMNIVNQNKKPIFGLETIADQMSAIDTQPLEDQVKSLKKIIMNFDSVKAEMGKMIEMYKSRNTDSLYAYMKKNGADDTFERELLVKRNFKWIPVITKAIKEASSFFAVGAGHLGGETGIIHLLRKEGYQIKAIKY
jgi:uncharacterized protein YbaP (TraB family)